MSARLIGTLIAIVLMLLGYWYFARGNDDRIPPQVVAAFEQNQKPILDKLNAATGEDRGKYWGELRTSMENLADNERQQTWRLIRADGERREDDRMRAFYKMTPAQQVADLDKRIDEMEAARQRFANRASTGNTGRGGPPGGGNGGGGGPPGGGDRGGRGRDPAARQRFAQQYVNNSTAESRAMRSDYFSRLDDRRKERGLPEMPSFGGPGGPGGGGPGGGGPGGFGGGRPRSSST